MSDPVTAKNHRNGSMLVAAALHQELQRDPDVLVFGEDVARLGGVFGGTRKLAQTFGDQRVFDTPISESAFVGMAIGAAQSGLRPVVEIMFADFIGVCFDQIINEMAKNTYMSGAEVSVPLVLRTAGGCIGSAAQHSQLLTATLAHIPGLKVVQPGTPADLQTLLVASIRSNDPVVFIEHKKLLTTRFSALAYNDAPSDDHIIEPALLGRSRLLREGGDVTIIASGWMVQQSYRAAEILHGEGIEAAVLDLRSIVPLDRDSLIAAASTASNVLVIDEDYLHFGISGEVIATIAETLGPHAPRMRRLAPAVSVPASRVLEAEVVPDENSIARAIRSLLAVR